MKIQVPARSLSCCGGVWGIGGLPIYESDTMFGQTFIFSESMDCI